MCVVNNLQIPSNLAMHNLCIIYASAFSFTIHVHYLRYLLKISDLGETYISLLITEHRPVTPELYIKILQERRLKVVVLQVNCPSFDSVALKHIDQICSFSQRGMAASSRLSSKTGVSHSCIGLFLRAQALTITFEPSTVALETTAFFVISPYSRSADLDFQFKMGAITIDQRRVS